MLNEKEIEGILRDTKRGARDAGEHMHHASYAASREIARRMKLPWKDFAPLVEREARLRRLYLEFQMAGFQVPSGVPTRAQAERLGAVIESAVRTLEHAGRLPKDRLERVYDDIEKTYREASAAGHPAPTPVRAKLKELLPLHAETAAGLLELLTRAKIGETHGDEKAVEFLHHSTQAYVALAHRVTDHWVKQK